MTDKVSDLEYDISKSEEKMYEIILQEYNDMYKEIKEDLNVCKAEQDDIRSSLQALSIEGKNSINVIHDDISRIHLEECCNEDRQNEAIINLQEEIAIFKKKQYSDQQLLLKTINDLSNKLVTQQIKCKDLCTLQKEQQVEIIKQQYSDVIKTLENKLLQAKDNFAKQQSLWMADKETIEILKQEKQKLESNLKNLQQTVKQKDENNQQMVQSLTEELSDAKTEIQRLNRLNLNKEKRLNESEKVVNNLIAKNEETQCKMAEALDLIECAIKEKNDVLQRETKLVEQNAKLETQLASIIKDHHIKMQEEIAKLKDVHEHDVKKYLIEIKEMKSKLREKETLLDRSERERRLLEEEIEKKHQTILLASIAKENAIKIQEEMVKVKEIDMNAHQVDAKKYLQNIEELKSALQEKETLLGQVKREKESIAEEKNKLEHENKSILDALHGSAATILQDFGQLNFDQTSNHTESKTCNRCKLPHSLKVQQLQEKITNLEENLVILNDKLKQSQQQDPTKNVQDCIILVDEKTKENEMSARLIHLENQLIDATNAKASLISELKLLRITFDCEIRKRDDERYTLEGKIRELEMNQEKCTKRNKAKVQKSAKKASERQIVKKNKSDTNIHSVQASSQHCEDTISTCTLDESIENKDDKQESLLAEKMKQQECFDKKMEKLKHLMITYKNLSKRWANETKALTEKFRVKFKELRGQISILKKKNLKLENKLRLLNET